MIESAILRIRENIEEVHNIISYKPFYETLAKKNITEYELIFKYGMSSNTIHRMKHGKPITTSTLNIICDILQCDVQDVLFHDKTK
ncbi:DNA-binding transcriptional regulator, XRE family [Lachnospiraceae bacterium A10]|nr:DNA-binding transcriptional regulator, XRE family [Lachnospiraceae bacterium A10]